MSTAQIDGVSVSTHAIVYFDGKCVSHGITFLDGTKKSVGVILPAAVDNDALYLLNHRPRKCLGYRALHEVFYGLQSSPLTLTPVPLCT